MKTFSKLAPLLILVGLYVGMCSAQVTINGYGSQYGQLVETGAVRNLGVYTTGGGTNLVNWSVVSGSATLSCTSNCPGTTTVTITETTGTASVTGSIGAYTLASTHDVVIRATAVDDGTKTYTFPAFHVQQTCNVGDVEVEPKYNQAYQGQSSTLQSYVTGCTNEGVTWTITSQPGGGDGTLTDTVNRDTRFHATVTGRYIITATSTANGSLAGSAIIYVAPQAMPAYAVTPNKTEPRPCYLDPALTGTVYEVGPTQTYHDLTTVDMQGWPAGSIVRLHNEDTTGSSPTTFHNATTIEGNGTTTQPLSLCGIPDSAGHLPILDGINATENPSDETNLNGAGAIKIVSQTSCFGNGYETASCGPDYVNIWGIRIQNYNYPYYYYAPGSGTPTQYGLESMGQSPSSGIYTRSGRHLHIEGVDIYNVGWGVIENNNTGFSQAQFASFPQFIGSHISQFSQNGSFSQHALYLEGMYPLVEGNLLENPASGDCGVFQKIRGGGAILRYNTMVGSACTATLAFPGLTDASPEVDVQSNLGMFSTFALTGVQASTGSFATYLNQWGQIFGGDPNLAFDGTTFSVTGFTNAVNNVTNLSVPSPGVVLPTTGLTYLNLLNSSAVAETHAATATRTTSCGQYRWCGQANNITLIHLAENQEAMATGPFVYGNILSNPNVTAVQIGSQAFPDGECQQPCSPHIDWQGQLYFWGNTVYQPSYVFQTADNSVNVLATPQYYFPTIFAGNNAMYGTSFNMNLDLTHIATYQTNVVPNTVSSIPPIAGGSGGWGNYTNQFTFSPTLALSTHMSGVSAANLIPASSAPFDTTTFAPTTGSPVIGAGSAISIPGGMPLRSQPDPLNGYITDRTAPTTIGAIGSASEPTPNSKWSGSITVSGSITIH